MCIKLIELSITEQITLQYLEVWNQVDETFLISEFIFISEFWMDHVYCAAAFARTGTSESGIWVIVKLILGKFEFLTNFMSLYKINWVVDY